MNVAVLTALCNKHTGTHAPRPKLHATLWLTALIISLPLLRYSIAHPDEFGNRSTSRACIPNRDFAMRREDLASTLQLPPPKLFIFKASPLSADFDDTETLAELQRLYPQGELTLHESNPWWQSFWVYFVPTK